MSKWCDRPFADDVFSFGRRDWVSRHDGFSLMDAGTAGVDFL